MKIIAKLLFSLLVGLMLVGTLYNFGLFHELKEKTESLSKQGLRHFLTIRDKLGVLEEVQDVFLEFSEYLETDDRETTETEALPEADTAEQTSLPADAETTPVSSEPQADETEPVPSENQTDTSESLPVEATTAAPETESLPHEQERETESETSTQGYTVRAHEGIIAVFDGDGVQILSVNVALMTLPEADRVALETGIFASDMEGVQEILDKLA